MNAGLRAQLALTALLTAASVRVLAAAEPAPPAVHTRPAPTIPPGRPVHLRPAPLRVDAGLRAVTPAPVLRLTPIGGSR